MQYPSSTAVISLRNEDEIVGLSQEFEELLGWTADDLIGTSIGRVLSSRDPARELLPPEGRPGAALRGIRRDGGTMDLMVECQRWRAGEDSFATLFLRPVDRRRSSISHGRAVDRALELEERLSALLDASPDAIIITNETGRVKGLNAAAERMFGFQEKDILGRDVADLLPAVEERRHSGHLAEPFPLTAEAGNGAPTETLAVHAGGGTFPVELSVGRSAGSEGISYIAVIRNITRRHNAAAALAHSESNLRMAQALAHLGSFEFVYPGDGTMYWSDEVFRILGADPAEGVPTIATLRDDILHPEDRDRVVSAVIAAARHGGILKLDYRIRRPDGAVRYVQTAARMFAGEGSDGWRVSGTILDVTDRHQTEEALRIERDRAELYLDLVGVIVVAVDADGKVTMINRQGLDILSVDEREVLGTNFFEMFIPQEFRQQVLSRFRDLVDSPGEAVLRVDEGWVETRAGNRRFIRWRNKKMRDALGRTVGVLGAGEDITEQRRIEEQLRQAEEELRLTFQHAPIGMATLDLEGHILSVNQSLCNMLDYGPNELLGLAVSEIIHPDDRGVAARLLRQLRDGDIDYVRHEKRYFRKDASVMHGIVRYSLIKDRFGRALLFVAQIVDRTEQIEAELEVRQQRERLAQVSRLGTMGEMAGGIAHELNQPLTAISNYVRACQRLIDSEAIETDEVREILDKVSQQARRAGMVIQGLRRFIKQREIVREAISVNRVVREVMMLAELDCRAHGVPVATEIDDDLPNVQGDPIQLQQVLLNLIRNAVDATVEDGSQEKGIRIIVRTEEPDEIVVSVADHGGGVSAENESKLFDPFFTTKKDGMGMGLALSRSIVERHGGQLVFEANPDGGAVFSMILPTLPEEE